MCAGMIVDATSKEPAAYPPGTTPVLVIGVNTAMGELAIGKPLRFMYNAAIWKRGRVVEGTSLEN